MRLFGQGKAAMDDQAAVAERGPGAAEMVELPAETPAIDQQLHLILYPKEIEAEVIQTLEAAGVPGYTEFPKMIGRGRHHRHFDNPIWPGSVGSIFTIVTAEQAPRLVEPLRALNRHLDERTKGLHGLHLFVLPCQQLI